MDFGFIIFSFGLLLSLVIGGVVGSYLARLAFGIPKYSWARWVEVIVYTLVIVLVLMFAIPTKASVEIIVLYFFVGLFASLASRAASTGVGTLSVYVKTWTMEKKERTREEKLMINVARILFSYGLSEEEVKDILVSAGFKKREVEIMLASHHFERGTNPLVKKIVELEEEIERLKSRR